MKSKTDALFDLMREAQSERQPSPTSLRRVISGCKVLGIEGNELWRVLAWLDIADGATGEPYSKHVPRIWP